MTENTKNDINVAKIGLNMDSSVNQLQKGVLSYALNAIVESFDGNSVSYQNELGNFECLQFPEGYKYIGGHYIQERKKHIFFLANPDDEGSEIGYMDNNDCVYRTLVNDPCLRFNVNYPIHKIVHKISNCSTEIYWADWIARRFMDIDNIPYKSTIGDTVCDEVVTQELDCNKLKVQPNFDIPKLEISDIINGGDLKAGTVQFAIAYSDVAGDVYTSYYSVTNPVPIANPQITTLNFDYVVGKSVVLDISNIDITGYFQYFNLAVIKTVNNISLVELIGTYTIDSKTKQIIYSGQNQTLTRLTINDIFEKFPYYEVADDLTNVQDVLVWKGLTSIDRINYQEIASRIKLYWESYRIPADENYADELNAANLRGYLRDEVYDIGIVFLLTNGKQTDRFHIPGRIANSIDLLGVSSTNEDFIGEADSSTGESPTWKIYNTASVLGTNAAYTTETSYKGPYQYGEFAYWESTETYPCNEEIWGNLAGKPIRHHKFPDCLISPIFESSNYSSSSPLVIEDRATYTLGIKLDVQQVWSIIGSSSLTSEQKENIAGFKIVRGDRSTNKSIVAKGILRNVGKYTREETPYYFANYPYNDLREDPFLLEQSNAFNAECGTYTFNVVTGGTYQYTNCFTNKLEEAEVVTGETGRVCSITVPVGLSAVIDTVTKIDFDTYRITSNENSGSLFVSYLDPDGDGKVITISPNQTKTINVETGSTPSIILPINAKYTIIQVNSVTNSECYPSNLEAFTTDDSKYRQVFNSPETSFGNPYLGSILKLESVIFGAGKAHFVEVKNNAKYKLLTKQAQEDALVSSEDIADITGTFSPSAMFAAYQSYLQIYINGITRRNYGWSYNSIAEYNYNANINNGLGIKQRELETSQYLIPGVQSINDDINFNNFNRESSIYLKTDSAKSAFSFPSYTPTMLDGIGNPLVEDKSRYINSQQDCSNPENQFDISTICYYGSLKNQFLNQWGQIFSYESVDTGFQTFRDEDVNEVTIFGGDTFICKFSFKTKLPFFIDNRVNAPDDSDIFYDEIGNIAYPEYWHSARSILYDYNVVSGSNPVLKNIISIKAHNLDCPNSQLPEPDSSASPKITNPGRTYYDGKMYMFAYGIPTFYCESSINVDLRQAFNNKEGDFWPHVSTGIPDDWVQEKNVPIVQDNTYYYNVTYSKQNKENFFSHLPDNWTEDSCFTTYPFRAVFSDQQQSFSDNRINSWLIYRPASYFDFPQNYGNFTSIDGIENKQILARFEDKSLLYNALYTNQTNSGGQVYLGQSLFSKDVPPLDFAETDLGYVGSQNKFLLKIPQGQISIDAKRGQVFLISGSKAMDISAFGSGLNRFFNDHLPFEILNYFPEINTDNHFTSVGVHGVYDSKYDRVIITKLDYIPLSDSIKYDSSNNTFYIEISPSGIVYRQEVYLSDSNYFCNKSWTVSFNLNTKSWISFHTYLSNFYIGENNFFYSGINDSCELEAIAAEIVSSTTTTTTTAFPFDCTLEGYAYSPDCDLEGFALGTTTTSTTTTTTTSTTTTTTTTTTLP